MGYTTDFIGHVDIDPPLNDQERAYLLSFAASRRWRRPGGEYEVPVNPYAERVEETRPGNIGDYNTPPGEQPGLWCDWAPCWSGCCLAFDGYEKFYSPVRWLRYLIGHFLSPDAFASASGDPGFDEFSFDHHCEGLVVGCRRDNKELFAIRVVDNVVAEEILRPADPRYLDLPPLAYEEYRDRERADLDAGKRPQPRGGTVWKLADQIVDARA